MRWRQPPLSPSTSRTRRSRRSTRTSPSEMEEKRKESSLDLLKLPRLLANEFGKMSVRFGAGPTRRAHPSRGARPR